MHLIECILGNITANLLRALLDLEQCWAFHIEPQAAIHGWILVGTSNFTIFHTKLHTSQNLHSFRGGYQLWTLEQERINTDLSCWEQLGVGEEQTISRVVARVERGMGHPGWGCQIWRCPEVDDGERRMMRSWHWLEQLCREQIGTPAFPEATVEANYGSLKREAWWSLVSCLLSALSSGEW